MTTAYDLCPRCQENPVESGCCGDILNVLDERDLAHSVNAELRAALELAHGGADLASLLARAQRERDDGFALLRVCRYVVAMSGSHWTEGVMDWTVAAREHLLATIDAALAGTAGAEAIEAVRHLAARRCHWEPDEDDVWRSTCGRAFQFKDQDPRTYRFQWCPYCGGRLDSLLTRVK